MKECTKCNEEKSLKEFHQRKTENRHSSWCKSCVYQLQKERWKDRKRKAIEMMGGECCQCGYKKNMAALEFHHIDPSTKEYDWDRLRLRKWETIIDELKKCILVCSNCHSEIHAPDLNITFEDQGKSNIVLNKGPQPTGKCPICDSDLFGTDHCSQPCAKMARRKVKRPTKVELKKLIKSNSWTALGRKFNVSDNAVRKWAKSYGILS